MNSLDELAQRVHHNSGVLHYEAVLLVERRRILGYQHQLPQQRLFTSTQNKQNKQQCHVTSNDPGVQTFLLLQTYFCMEVSNDEQTHQKLSKEWTARSPEFHSAIDTSELLPMPLLSYSYIIAACFGERQFLLNFNHHLCTFFCPQNLSVWSHYIKSHKIIS